MRMIYKFLPEFNKEFGRLEKKYPSLQEDLLEFENILTHLPSGNGKHFALLKQNSECKIFKARFFCRYLKGNSLRIIYAYFPGKNEIVFLEIYAKNESENENRERIKGLLRLEV